MTSSAERALQAQLNERFGRSLRLASLRWLAVASVPVWLQAMWGVLPDLVAFWALLGQGALVALAAAFTVLERRWRLRAARLAGTSAVPVVHVPWSAWEEVRSAPWHALALVSFVPWAYVALHRPVPRSLLSAALAGAAALFLLAVVAETLPRRRARDEGTL